MTNEDLLIAAIQMLTSAANYQVVLFDHSIDYRNVFKHVHLIYVIIHLNLKIMVWSDYVFVALMNWESIYASFFKWKNEILHVNLKFQWLDIAIRVYKACLIFQFHLLENNNGKPWQPFKF